MKKLMRLLVPAVILLPSIILWSCEKKANESFVTGTAEFSISLPAGLNTKSAITADSVNSALQLLVSVTDMQGNAIITDKLVPVYTFGTGLTSEAIEIKTGDFRLVKFMVINASGAVIYAAPVGGSPMAYLCSHPLPMPFHVSPGEVTRIMPEVLVVGDLPPEKFGYVAFGIQIIKPLEFWTYCILDNPLLMAPILLTPAKLTISTPNGWRYSFMLEPKINHLVIRGGSDIYYFMLEKEGYLPQKMQFTARQLLERTEASPLILRIPFNSQSRTLVLQPGPEKGIDAMISNLEPEKNFGDHRYFEASFISEPVLTVMRSNRSLISFTRDSLPKSAVIRKVVLTLWYDIPLPVPASAINTDPLSPGWYGAVFQRITEPWDEHKVTWSNQPATTEVNQVFLSPFIKNSNAIEIDITKLFVPVSTTDVPGYGFMFRLWPAEKFQGFRFVSSDYSIAAMRPRLTVTYSM